MVAINTRFVGNIVCVFGILIVLVSIILLVDKIQQNKDQEQYLDKGLSAQRIFGSFLTTFNLEDSTIMILAPITVIVGFGQTFYPCLIRKEPWGTRSTTCGLLFSTILLLLITTFCFGVGFTYRIDLHKNAFRDLAEKDRDRYGGRGYLQYGDRYGYGFNRLYLMAQIYLAMLGLDGLLLLITVVWLLKRLLSLNHTHQAKYKYQPHRNNRSCNSPMPLFAGSLYGDRSPSPYSTGTGSISPYSARKSRSPRPDTMDGPRWGRNSPLRDHKPFPDSHTYPRQYSPASSIKSRDSLYSGRDSSFIKKKWNVNRVPRNLGNNSTLPGGRRPQVHSRTDSLSVSDSASSTNHDIGISNDQLVSQGRVPGSLNPTILYSDGENLPIRIASRESRNNEGEELWNGPQWERRTPQSEEEDNDKLAAIMDQDIARTSYYYGDNQDEDCKINSGTIPGKEYNPYNDSYTLEPIENSNLIAKFRNELYGGPRWYKDKSPNPSNDGNGGSGRSSVTLVASRSPCPGDGRNAPFRTSPIPKEFGHDI